MYVIYVMFSVRCFSTRLFNIWLWVIGLSFFPVKGRSRRTFVLHCFCLYRWVRGRPEVRMWKHVQSTVLVNSDLWICMLIYQKICEVDDCDVFISEITDWILSLVSFHALNECPPSQAKQTLFCSRYSLKQNVHACQFWSRHFIARFLSWKKLD